MLTSDLAAPARVLIDTHIWVWAAAGETGRFSAAAAREIDRAAAERRLFISATSVWEIALKVQTGALELTSDLRAWVREQQREPGVRIWPLSPAVLVGSVQLPEWIRVRDGKPHRDPCDRFLVATARERHAVLVTSDAEILTYGRAGHVTACDARG